MCQAWSSAFIGELWQIPALRYKRQPVIGIGGCWGSYRMRAEKKASLTTQVLIVKCFNFPLLTNPAPVHPSWSLRRKPYFRLCVLIYEKKYNFFACLSRSSEYSSSFICCQEILTIFSNYFPGAQIQQEHWEGFLLLHTTP